jgi:hypothetical protein
MLLGSVVRSGSEKWEKDRESGEDDEDDLEL